MAQNALYKWRKQIGFTQKNLSDEIGIPQPKISMHEKGMHVSPKAMEKYRDSKIIPNDVLDKISQQ